MDSFDGKAVPYAAVLFEGSSVGVATDDQGRFSLSTGDMTLSMLEVRQLGYVTSRLKVKPGKFNDIVVMLRRDDVRLPEARVKADNSRIKRLLAAIDARKDRNDPSRRAQYSCDAYTKAEVGFTNPEQQIKGKRTAKEWAFIWDFVDTSDVSGIPYLPLFMNEALSTRYYGGGVEREVVHASRMSGSGELDHLFNQFTGSVHFKANFYDSHINAFNVEIPSPAGSSGLLYYNYFIVDSLQMDSRKTLLVRYHPKPLISAPAFDGQMLVDAEDYAITGIKARLAKGQNINWLRDLALEASYTRLQDSTWFFKGNRLYADFSVVQSDSSKVISLVANRTVEFSNPEFENVDVPYNATVTTIEKDATEKSDRYWEKNRPGPLSFREKNIYKMTSMVESTRSYRVVHDIISVVVNGYYEHGPLGYGPVLNMLSFNPLEGFRMRLGVRTTEKVSRKNRYMVYAAFGCKDLAPKGGLEWEHLFSKDPTSKLTVDLHYDAVQLGKGSNILTNGSILYSLLGGGFSGKMCTELVLDTKYEHEFAGWCNAAFNARYREIYQTPYVPMLTPAGSVVHSIPGVQGGLEFRFSKAETVLRGRFNKTFAQTKYPVVSLCLNAGVTALNAQRRWIGAGVMSKVAHAYFIPELKLSWNATTAPVGRTMLYFNAGTIVGKVPYTHLHLHEGNGSFMLDKTAFSTMDFFEFVSDTWLTLRWEHDFQGFFLGKIPWVKKLQLREAFVFKATWGALSDRNNGVVEGRGMLYGGPQAVLMFPEGMHTMGPVPYIETGFAITNILRLFRIDFLWRVTHRDDPRPKPRNFVVNLGLDVKF